MNTIFTIAKYTLLEAIRDKFVWFVFAVMLFGLIVGKFFQSITLFGAESSFPATAITGITLAVSLVSVLYVNIATRRELDGRIMQVILSRPISNLQYLLGKHLGFWLFASFYSVIGGILALILGFANAATVGAFVLALIMVQCISVAWSLFFALLLNSVAASIVVSVVAWGLFNVTQVLWIMAERSEDKLSMYLGKLFYYILPNYSRFDLKNAVLYNDTINWGDFALLPLYMIVYTVMIMIFAWFDFSKKEY